FSTRRNLYQRSDSKETCPRVRELARARASALYRPWTSTSAWLRRSNADRRAENAQAAGKDSVRMQWRFLAATLVARIGDPGRMDHPQHVPPMSATADSLFELRASYVSVSTMSGEPRRGVGCRAQSKETEGT